MQTSPENILLIGDSNEGLRSAIADLLPDAVVTSVPTVFDGIAELTTSADGQALADGWAQGDRFTTVLAAAEPMERRPEAAVRTLRDLAGNSRLVLFGQSTLELLSRKMLKFGCDDYLVTPASGEEIEALFATPNPRLAPPPQATTNGSVEASVARNGLTTGDEQAVGEKLVAMDGRIDYATLGTVFLDALLQHPHDPIAWTLRLISQRLSPLIELHYRANGEAAPAPEQARDVLSHPITTPDGLGGTLYAAINENADESAAREILQQLAPTVSRVAALQVRHAALQKMAITDELTGVYNGRYFRHFLTRILEKARNMHFPVTLLMFDIDDFKTYNDQYGHQVGDEILKQTAAMMRKCTREHDLVARIGGDEFAVVFWDKEGPRQPREPRPGIISRPPQSPVQIFERFKRMIQSDRFTALGTHGRGKLGISAGLAVYPYEGHDMTTLIAAADNALMKGAKKHGKNRLSLVGNGNGGHSTPSV